MRIRQDRLTHSIAALSLFWALGHGAASAQTPAAAGQEPAPSAKPTVVMPAERKMAGARDAESYCAGFIEYQPSADRFEVVGGEQEQE